MKKIPEFFHPEFWSGRIHHLLAFVLILIATFVIGKIVKVVLEKFFKKSSEIIHVDLSKYRLIKNLIVTGIHVVGIGLAIYSIPALRALSLSIFAGAGIIAAVIGFASQKAFSNIISGIFILLFKPFRVDDRIQVGIHFGVVEDITLRHTVIKNPENRRIVIPNSIISDDTVINSTIVDEKTCKIMDFGIGFSSDIAKARKIIQEEATKHPFYLDNRTNEEKSKGDHPVPVRVFAWAESSVQLRAWIWTKDPVSAFLLGCDLYETVKNRFLTEGVEIPFPHRTLFVHNSQNKN